jgi:hypothetical protein
MLIDVELYVRLAQVLNPPSPTMETSEAKTIQMLLPRNIFVLWVKHVANSTKTTPTCHLVQSKPRTPNKPQDKTSRRKIERWYVGHWNTHKGARAIYILVYLPEMEVHARGEDCEDHELETVHGYKFGYC